MSFERAEDARDISIGLLSFGLTEYESRTYVALLANGPCTVNQLQYTAGVPRTKVYSAAMQLMKKGLVNELEGKPARFQAHPPDSLQAVITDGERRVRNLKRVLGSLRKVSERHVQPLDTTEERYVSLGSQSLLTKLKENILRTQSRIRCIVDGWGLHLVEDCADELETVRGQEVEVMIVAPPLPLPRSLDFAYPKIRVRYGKYVPGKSIFVFDNSDVILVNSQTGRGYLFMLSELRALLVEELFEDRWKMAVDGRAFQGIAGATEDLSSLLDTPLVQRLFIQAVSRAIKDEKLVERVGSEFVGLLQESVSPRLKSEKFDGVIRLVSALMEEELGSGAKIEYDPLTRILRFELPEAHGPIPNSVWYYALVGLIGSPGYTADTLQNAVYPEARKRVIQTKITGTVSGS